MTLKMLPNVLCVLLVSQVLSEAPPAPPAPPQNIHVDKWQLTWSPATDEGDVTYTAQYTYSSFESNVWTDVPGCVRTSLNSCSVISTKAGSEHDCVMIRVQAERRGLTSKAVKACSNHGDTCTPDFILTAGPGYLTVRLSTNNTLASEHAYNAQHRVYYGKEGEPLQDYKDDVASMIIDKLQEGQRYCIKVQYMVYHIPVGLATCTQCEVIPESRKDSQQTVIAVSVVVVVVLLLFLFLPIAYFFIFQSGTIKKWLRPPCKIPDFFLDPLPEHLLPNTSSSPPPKEHCDVISSIFPEEVRE